MVMEGLTIIGCIRIRCGVVCFLSNGKPVIFDNIISLPKSCDTIHACAKIGYHPDWCFLGSLANLPKLLG